MAGWMLQMRNVMITTIGEDYVLVAQAKGLSPRRVMFTYAARNAILPNIAGFALSIGFVVAGALVMEIVFSYPGIGLTLYNAVTSDDFPLLQGIFLVISLSVLLRLPARRRRLLLRRPAHPDEGGVLMAIAAVDPSPRRSSRRRAARAASSARLPRKAKVGAAILARVRPGRDHRPGDRPVRPDRRPPRPGAPARARPRTHLLGTTATGQDVLSQLLVGTRSTVVLGLLTGVIATILSVVIGISAGFLGGVVRRGAVAARQRVPGPAGAAAAGRDPRLPPALAASCRRRSC